MIDFVGQAETIDASLQVVAEQLNLDRRSLPVENRSREDSEQRSYREAYTETARETVYKYYYQDIETFEYVFSPLP